MTQRSFYLSIAIAVSIFSLGYGLFVILGNYDNFPLHLPDDAFYYLQMAKWHADEGIYSFDGGQTTNTGFHLLWFYWVSFLAMLTSGDSTQLLRFSTMSSWLVCAAIAMSLIYWSYLKYPHMLTVIALFLSGYAFTNGQVAAMEWHLCVLLSLVIFALFYYLPLIKYANPTLFILGILGSFARYDFGGVAACAVSAALIVYYLLKTGRYIKPAIALLAGAVVGFICIGVHNYLIADDWMPSSARMKQAWAALSHPNPFAPAYQFARSFLYIVPLSGEDKLLQREKLLTTALYVSPALLIAGGIFFWHFRRYIITTFNYLYHKATVSLAITHHPSPITHHPSPITHHPSPITHHPSYL